MNLADQIDAAYGEWPADQVHEWWICIVEGAHGGNWHGETLRCRREDFLAFGDRAHNVAAMVEENLRRSFIRKVGAEPDPTYWVRERFAREDV